MGSSASQPMTSFDAGVLSAQPGGCANVMASRAAAAHCTSEEFRAHESLPGDRQFWRNRATEAGTTKTTDGFEEQRDSHRSA
jgi:hypothetical protein